VEFVSFIGSLSTRSSRATRPSEMLLGFDLSEHSERRAVSLPIKMTLNHWVVGSIPRRCMPHNQRVTRFKLSTLVFRLGHFSATFGDGLVGFIAAIVPFPDRFANRDLGRIFKTEFILQYFSEPKSRSRIRRGLLTVEQLHALARDVFYRRRGRINARELWEQMNTCSCLNLILACIVYWQAWEISRVLSQCDAVANGVDTSLAGTRQPHRVG
jgi:hypothetical protein